MFEGCKSKQGNLIVHDVMFRDTLTSDDMSLRKD